MMKTKKKSKVRKGIILSIVFLLIAGAAAAYLLRPKALPYDSVSAQTGDITTNYQFSGNIETKNRQTVIAQRVLQIATLDVVEGEPVQEGDRLLKTTAGEEIKAKINGEISSLQVEEGAQVMAGTTLMEIVDYDHLQISIKVDEYDLPAVQAGRSAAVKIGAIGKELTGNIRSISKEGTVMNGVTFFTADIDLKKDPKLKIGMTADVSIVNQKAAGVVILPMTAIQFDVNNNPYVFKEGEDNAVVKATIKTGTNDGQNAEIKEGVAAGETIYYPTTNTTSSFGFGGRMGGNQSSAGNT